MKYIILLFLTITCFFFEANAQKDNTQEATYEYTPKLLNAKKIVLDPTIPKNAVSNVKLTINPKNYQYLSRPAITVLPPKMYSDPLLDISHNPNYLRLGGGNYGHKLAEIYISNRENSKWSYGLSYAHLSADQSKSLRDFSDNKANIWGSRFYGRSSISTKVYFQRDMNRFYGFDSVKPSDLSNQLKKIGTNIGGLVAYDLKAIGKKIGTNVAIDINNYHNTLKQSELNYGAKIGLDAILNEYRIFGNLSFNQLEFRQKAITKKQSIFRIEPRVKWNDKKQNIDATAGVNFSFISGLKEPYINAVLQAETKLKNLNVTAYGGIDGGLMVNSVRTFAQQIPFTSDSILIKNSFETIKGRIGLKGKITQNSQFIIEMGGNSIEDMPLIVSNKDSINSSNLVYTRVGNIWFIGDLRFSIGDKLTIGGNFKVNNYQTATQAQAWNLPIGEYGFNAQYYLKKNFVFDAGVRGIGSWYNKQLVTNTQTNINGYADVHARVDYRIKDIARIWIQGSNLLNKQYTPYFNYRVYGLTILGGISASF